MGSAPVDIWMHALAILISPLHLLSDTEMVRLSTTDRYPSAAISKAMSWTSLNDYVPSARWRSSKIVVISILSSTVAAASKAAAEATNPIEAVTLHL